jgi:ubiquinone biosynthesis protein COQ4
MNGSAGTLGGSGEARRTASGGADAGFIDEAGAIRVALEGGTTARLWVVARALGRLLVNASDTVQVFILGIVLNAPRVPRLYERIAADAVGARLLEQRPTIDSKAVDFDRLRSLPASTLGGAYARYLGDNRLDPDLFQPPPGLPESIRWIAQRIRQTHDIWHVLTGYAPDVPGELALQGFTYAQLRMPSSLAIAVLGTLFKSPLSARAVWRGYERGAAAKFLPVVEFEAMWDRPLDEVRRELGIG